MIGSRYDGRVMPMGFSLDEERLRDIARRHGVRELSLFGSMIRGDSNDNSDVDVLVSFYDGVSIDLDRWMALRDELTAVFQREVDLVLERNLNNPYRRREILGTRRVIYAA